MATARRDDGGQCFKYRNEDSSIENDDSSVEQ